MPPILIDSNVLLDILGEPNIWTAWSALTLERVAQAHRLVINAVIFAEVSVRYSTIEALDEALPTTLFQREPIPFPAAFLAGKAYLAYRRRGGSRQSLLPDFIIGAHASVAGYQLLTRDAARYRTYFPRVSLIVPET
jgi:predicted nucleic acid-binding protein